MTGARPTHAPPAWSGRPATNPRPPYDDADGQPASAIVPVVVDGHADGELAEEGAPPTLREPPWFEEEITGETHGPTLLPPEWGQAS